MLQFKPIRQPLAVCAAIPLSFIDAFMMLCGWNQAMSCLAFIGMTSLMGVVVNNSILLVDEANQWRLMDPDMPISEVATNAACNRFMPILLTSVTSIVGLLPLALGNTMFKALAIVVIAGLTTATFFTLLCIPVLFSLVTGESKPVHVTQRWTKNPTGGNN